MEYRGGREGVGSSLYTWREVWISRHALTCTLGLSKRTQNTRENTRTDTKQTMNPHPTHTPHSIEPNRSFVVDIVVASGAPAR